jgi:hypothetical protein
MLFSSDFVFLFCLWLTESLCIPGAALQRDRGKGLRCNAQKIYPQHFLQCNLRLHNFLAAALNQIDECAGKQYRGRDANDDCGIHVFFSFLWNSGVQRRLSPNNLRSPRSW